MRRTFFAVSVATTVAALSAATGTAHAAGLYFSDRGVRPLGRGGAFVAGADDIGATWYNPAGLADAGDSFLLDASWLNYSAEFTRKTQVTDAGGTVRTYQYPTVDGSTPFIPLPTIGISKAFGKQKQFTFAFSVYVPYTPVVSYPEKVNGLPAPSRYSVINAEGSALAIPGVYFAWKPIEQFRVGAGVQLLAGKFNSYQVLTANPSDRLIGAPEDPHYDTYTKLSATIISPSGTLGIVAEPIKLLRFGLSFQLPFWINAPATNNIRLPDAAIFDKAYQDGNGETVKFRLPPIVRVGVQISPELGDGQVLKAELSYVREFWSMHDSIDINHEDFKLRGVTGFPDPFKFANISIPRNFQDSNSFRLGVEYTRKAPVANATMTFRGGVAFETSAVPKEYVSPLSTDADKVSPGIGFGMTFGGRLRIDAMFSHIFAFAPDVDPAEAKVPRINPASGYPTQTEAINGGSYSFRANILGLGMEYKY